LVDLWIRDGSEIRYVRDVEVEQLDFLSDSSGDRRPNLPFGFVLQMRPKIAVVLGDSLKPGGITTRCS
jgi:hypothetical protein